MLQEAVNVYIELLSERGGAGGRDRRNTLLAYRNDLQQLSTYLTAQGIEQWSQVTREQIAAYLLSLREGRAYRPATVARKVATLKAFFRYLQQHGHISVDPVEQLEIPRIQKELPRVLTLEQVNNLFAQVDVESAGGLRDLTMLQVLYSTGMRVSELVALDVEDVDPTHAAIYCAASTGQVSRDRVLPLSAEALGILAEYLELARPAFSRPYQQERALFLNHHGERLTRQGFWLIVKKYARAANIVDITPQMLRHTFAALMLQDGLDLRSVQELLGHAHISTTQPYSQLIREQQIHEPEP